jgi:hypothetical protein
MMARSAWVLDQIEHLGAQFAYSRVKKVCGKDVTTSSL